MLGRREVGRRIPALIASGGRHTEQQTAEQHCPQRPRDRPHHDDGRPARADGVAGGQCDPPAPGQRHPGQRQGETSKNRRAEHPGRLGQSRGSVPAESRRDQRSGRQGSRHGDATEHLRDGQGGPRRGALDQHDVIRLVLSTLTVPGLSKKKKAVTSSWRPDIAPRSILEGSEQ